MNGSRTDYASNSGSSVEGLWSLAPAGNDPAVVDAPGFAWPSTPNFKGVFVPFGNVTISEIGDGTTNTYLIGEKYLNPDDYAGYAAPADNQPIYVGYDWDMSRRTAHLPASDRPGSFNSYAFGSAHAGIFQMVFCDGSVHSVGFSIDKDVHRYLGDRRDGEDVTRSVSEEIGKKKPRLRVGLVNSTPRNVKKRKAMEDYPTGSRSALRLAIIGAWQPGATRPTAEKYRVRNDPTTDHATGKLQRHAPACRGIGRTPISLAMCLLLATVSAHAEDKPAEKEPTNGKAKAAKQEAVEKTPVVTRHELKIGKQKIKYTATTGRIAQMSDDGKEKAHIFFVAFAKEGVDNVAKRPVTFCFNGGPGSSSVWLHLGMAGPWKVKIPDDATTPRPPFQLEPNRSSLLDMTDLVFIDPVSTGYSRPAQGEKKEQFHGYEEDIRSVAQFIHDYTTQYGRWPSPKFLLGESYGGVRAAGLSGWLRSRYKLELNGAIVISGVIDFQTLRFDGSNDLAYISFLPSYAATAWYHQKLDEDLQTLPLSKVVQQAEKFAAGPYAAALLKGTAIGAKEKQAVATEFARFTGLSQSYVAGANLRVRMSRFAKELLRDRARTVGRFDSRYLGIDTDTVGEDYEYDASAAAISGVFTAAMNAYLHDTLKYEDSRVYEIISNDVHPWNFGGFENRYVDASDTLRRAMTENPFLKVFAACGYYDLATPGFGMELTRDHLGLAPERRSSFAMRYYEGGHMMYIYEPSLKKLHRDLARFFADAAPTE